MLSNKELGQYLKIIREKLEYSTHDINKLCDISQSFISLMENGKRKASPIVLKKLASVYNLDYRDLYKKAGYEYLLEENLKVAEESAPYNYGSSIFQYYMCPVYGRISAGQPNWAEECIEGRIPIDIELMNIVDPEECFFLRVSGESMNKEIRNGAYALIRKTDFVENGEIAVVLVNGFDATLKKFTKQGELIILEPMSTDQSFETQVYDKNTEVKVIGKYIGKMEMK